MKTIVICGGGRNVGKTTLALALVRHLPGAKAVKLGHHLEKNGVDTPVLPLKTAFKEIEARFSPAAYLVIESGSILDDPDCHPDLVVFLPAPKGDKPGSESRRSRADLIAGRLENIQRFNEISSKLEVESDLLRAALETVGTFVKTDT